jgi:hypothetical protein
MLPSFCLGTLCSVILRTVIFARASWGPNPGSCLSVIHFTTKLQLLLLVFTIILCVVILCKVILCVVILCVVILCVVILCVDILCKVILCVVILCVVILCVVILCVVILCVVILCVVILFNHSVQSLSTIILSSYFSTGILYAQVFSFLVYN